MSTILDSAKVDFAGNVYLEQEVNGIVGRMPVVTTGTAGAFVSRSGKMYKEVKVNGRLGRVEVVSLSSGSAPTLLPNYFRVNVVSQMGNLLFVEGAFDKMPSTAVNVQFTVSYETYGSRMVEHQIDSIANNLWEGIWITDSPVDSVFHISNVVFTPSHDDKYRYLISPYND